MVEESRHYYSGPPSPYKKIQDSGTNTKTTGSSKICGEPNNFLPFLSPNQSRDTEGWSVWSIKAVILRLYTLHQRMPLIISIWFYTYHPSQSMIISSHIYLKPFSRGNKKHWMTQLYKKKLKNPNTTATLHLLWKNKAGGGGGGVLVNYRNTREQETLRRTQHFSPSLSPNQSRNTRGVGGKLRRKSPSIEK
jgi:hypothetical protein